MKKKLLIAFIIASASSFLLAQEESSNEKFYFGIQADYLKWDAVLTSYSINGESIPAEFVDLFNQQYSFLANSHSYNIVFGYDILKNLCVLGRFGLNSIEHESENDEIGEESNNSIISNNPGFSGGMKIQYSFPIKNNLIIRLEPSVLYKMTRDPHIVNDFESFTFQDNSSMDLLSWKMGTTLSYILKEFEVFAGAAYFDFHKKLDYTQISTDSFDNYVVEDKVLTFNSKSKVYGIAGFSINLGNDKFFSLRANIGSGFLVCGTLMFKV